MAGCIDRGGGLYGDMDLYVVVPHESTMAEPSFLEKLI